MSRLSNRQEEDMIDRLAKTKYANPTCADCQARYPRWVSFLRDSLDQNQQRKVPGSLAVVVCDDCAILHHQVLTEKRCSIKCLECVHEWTQPEMDVVTKSGNALTNSIYEAELLLQKEEIAKEGMQTNFIKQKYKRHSFRDEELLEKFLRGESKSRRSSSKKGQRESTRRSSDAKNKKKSSSERQGRPQFERASSLSALVPNNSSYSTSPRRQRVSKAIRKMNASNRKGSSKRTPSCTTSETRSLSFDASFSSGLGNSSSRFSTGSLTSCLSSGSRKSAGLGTKRVSWADSLNCYSS